jgi:FkbM family methyltransferase
LKPLISILEKTEGLLRKIKNKLQRGSDNQFNEVERWYQEDPHKLKRTDFDFLTSDSIVFDLGGYEGEWTSDIYARFNCNVYVFEPVSEFANIIKQRFAKNEKIKVYAIGLAEKNSEVLITIDKFASRIGADDSSAKPTEKIQLKSFTEFITENRITTIDLLKINIEGAEFPLLEDLSATGTLGNIKCLLIQFHNFAENAIARRKKLQEELSKTHVKLFDYAFVWECWKLKRLE